MLAPGRRDVANLQSDFKVDLLLLMTIAGLVFLIACVNITNLLLVRRRLLRDRHSGSARS